MVEREQIRSYCEQIAREFKPEKIILFGSYAYGQPHEGSDVDLLVIMPTEDHPARKAAEIAVSAPRHLPIEIIVRSPERIRDCLEERESFTTEVMSRGTVLYEKVH
jgi:predicted nucleotidyltransferase